MSSVRIAEPPRRESLSRRLSSFLHRHPYGRLVALLALPVGWLLVIYLGSLTLLLLAAFWDTETFTNDVVRHWNLDNFRQILQQEVYRDVALRTTSSVNVSVSQNAAISSSTSDPR